MSSDTTTLVVKHLHGTDPASFHVTRLHDAKTSKAATVRSPVGFPVEGRPNSDLMRELQWYLESFLDYPFPPETEHAERLLKALRVWGEQAFLNLFGNRSAGRMFDIATRDYSQLHLRVSSDDSRVLAWPWEALYDPELGFLAHTCQVVRHLNEIRDPQELPASLPTDRVNILLVVARPYEQDVRFHSLARPLMELIEREKLPATVELLRPPTFSQLRKHLREHPGFYHILHFDGHGAFSADATGRGVGFTLQGAEGKLIFETEEGEEDPVPADKLSTLLKECAVPCVVLNACQSAMTASNSRDPFASVAIALLRSGMRDVVAMAYSLYVSAAQQFLPAFYRNLFEAGSMARAVRAGRQQMWQYDKRVCVRGEFPLQDWLLPVLYQQDPLNFSFAKARKGINDAPRESRLAEELRRENPDYGFIGRDSAILELERAMRRTPAGILIQGLGGVGKTTVARGFLQWLDQTGGLEHPPFWFSFQEIHSVEYVFDRLGEAVVGPNFAALTADNFEKVMQGKIKAITSVLRENRVLIVWDNFESAGGIPGTSVEANLPELHRELLARFLDELRGGKAKVLITSRSREEWLGPQRRFLLRLGGLDGEERWEYCNAILRDLGKKIDRNDKDLVDLMNVLGGHPLAMQAILPQLEQRTPSQLLAAVRSNLENLKFDGDDAQAKLYATLAVVEQSVQEELRPLLFLVGMHEGFLDSRCLEEMCSQVDAAWSKARIDSLLYALGLAGFLQEISQGTYEMHPLLTSYLRSPQRQNAIPPDRDTWEQAFVDIIGTLANELSRRKRHERRLPFHRHGQNFYLALAESERLGMSTHSAALMQTLALFAFDSRNFNSAQRLCERLAENRKAVGDTKGEGAAYHQLGRIAEEQHNFLAAEECYLKALAPGASGDYAQAAARAYHQLGVIAEKRHDFTRAEESYCKALEICEKLGNQADAAGTYIQLGVIAHKQSKFTAAEEWYLKALAIGERLGDIVTTAGVYHQMGSIADERRDLAAAQQWYRKSLAISEKFGLENYAAGSYHQLGNVAKEQRDFAAAEEWYLKALAINEKLGIESSAATTYEQLGSVATERRDFVAAEAWYRKALAINEKIGDEFEAAGNYVQLGGIARKRRDFLVAEQWYCKSLAISEKLGFEGLVAKTYHTLGSLFRARQDLAMAQQWYRKSLPISKRLGDEHLFAMTTGNLGIVACERGDVFNGGQELIKAVAGFLRTGDRHIAATYSRTFMRFYVSASIEEQGKLKTIWQEAGLEEFHE